MANLHFQLSCDNIYIGKTRRRLHDRKTEHFRALTNYDKSSVIVDHIKTTGHNIEWDNFDFLASGKTDYHCIIKDTLFIHESQISCQCRQWKAFALVAKLSYFLKILKLRYQDSLSKGVKSVLWLSCLNLWACPWKTADWLSKAHKFKQLYQRTLFTPFFYCHLTDNFSADNLCLASRSLYFVVQLQSWTEKRNN